MPCKRCFVSKCSSSSDQENNGVPTFVIPKGKLEEWAEIMKHKPGLNKNYRFCYLHFKDEDIIKGYEILGVFHEHKRWRLKAETKPTLHLGC